MSIDLTAFYTQINENFRNIDEKMDKYHKDNCQKIDSVKQDVVNLKVELASHLASSSTAVQIKNENKEQGNHKIYWVLGIVSMIQVAIIAAFETLRGN